MKDTPVLPLGSPRRRMRWRLLFAVVAMAVPVAACTSAQTPSAGAPDVAAATDSVGVDVPRENAQIKVGDTFVGNYLAGRHAQAMRDGPLAIKFFRAALADDPGNQDLMLRAVVVMISEGQFAEAVPLARKLIADNPDDTVVAYVVAVDDLKAGKFDAAAKRLLALPDNGINRYVGPLLGAWALAGEKKFDDALKELAKLKNGQESNALYDLHEALILEMAGRQAQALDAFAKATSSEATSSFRLIELYGALLQRAGKADQAKAVYEKFLGQHPDSKLLVPALADIAKGTPPPVDIAGAADGAAQGLFDLAGAFRQQNAHEMALVLGRLALELRPNFPAAQIVIGDILEASDRPETANEIYKTIDPASPFARSARLRIDINLDDMDHTNAAVADLKAMAKANPKDPEPLITLGNILRSRERFPEAVDAYDGAIKRIGTLEPRHWSLLYARGIALERSKMWPRAEADFEQALKFEPNQPYVLNYLGYSWVDQGLHLEKALGMIREAVKLRPNDGYIVDSLGWALYRMGKLKEAVVELERAIELRPEDPIINDHLGDAYWKVGRHREARFQWQRSLALKPEPSAVAGIEKKIEDGLPGTPGKNG